MSELINTAPVGVTQNRAYELHQYIIAQARVAGQAISEIGRSLKEMRDSKLYLELGHETFEAYTEDMLNIKQRQAYNYISIFETYGPKFIDAHADLGISKLLLLQAVPVYDREDFMEENDVGDLTTRELKELTEKYTKACEQLSLMEEKKTDLEEDNRIVTEREQRLQEQKKELEIRIKQLEARPVDVAVEEPSIETLASIRKEAEKTAAANQKEAIAKAVEKAEKKAAKDAEEKIKAAKEEAKKEAEEALQASLQAVEREKAAALERAKAMEKQLSLGANPDTVLFKHLFDEIQSIYNRLVGTIKKLEASGAEADTEAAAKFKGAVRKLLEMLIKQLGD